ncbi:aspartate carbamoyltransferase [Candidatus Korarchaeum cryptofilum]|jgi:aspartate carbamoyltransferase catalytic subunit|uniref:Aspartate carbamoyltransferase n=1 Tax=Candidatus Korarchaeum cryptofilum TaxID=498846 RepID=A0A429G044_9CREN|nr:aspartate carbamoyltransferase [Candidatus Korarchaeum cryptofilum]RSN67174.1 aspartate carbamoyltransferase [Candidatus Korarchaeum cryptofilum]
MSLRGKDIISISDIKRSDLERIFRVASSRFQGDELKGKIIAMAFFEPSTRTRFSFETATLRLGGNYIGFEATQSTSLAKGESFSDTIRMLDSYADGIVVRHSLEGAAKLAAELAEAPVINAGDGTKNHPTQAMIDLYTIWKERGNLDNLTYGVLGDLRYGRAAASFLKALNLYSPKKVYLICPEGLRPKQELLDSLKMPWEFSDLKDALPELDVLYVTRVQKERFPDPSEYERVKGSYKVDSSILKDAKEGLMILHPLPRVDEISLDVDSTPYAYYFKQAANGVPVRMALLSEVIP